MDGEHDVRRDDGGVDIGEVAFIIGAHPCFICFSSDDEKDTGTEGIVRCLREFCTGGGALDRPDLKRLFVDGRRRKACCFEDAA